MLADSGSVTSLCKFVKLSTGGLVTAVQLVVVKSEFSCSTKLVEGTSQERSSWSPVAARLKRGANCRGD